MMPYHIRYFGYMSQRLAEDLVILMEKMYPNFASMYQLEGLKSGTVKQPMGLGQECLFPHHSNIFLGTLHRTLEDCKKNITVTTSNTRHK